MASTAHVFLRKRLYFEKKVLHDFHRELITLKTINSDKNISQILILVPNSSSSPWLVGSFYRVVRQRMETKWRLLAE